MEQALEDLEVPYFDGFMGSRRSSLIMFGYSFNDGHLNDAIINVLKVNPTAMVLGLMHDRYEITSGTDESSERYSVAYRLAKKPTQV